MSVTIGSLSFSKTVNGLSSEKRLAIIEEVKALIKENDGVLPPETWVEFAENPATASHSYFNWDDVEAGRKYRIIQAREFLRVTVQYLPMKDGSLKEYRVFTSLPSDRKYENGIGGYRTMVSVLNDDQLRQQLVDAAFEELEMFKRKYRNLTELADVFVVIDSVTRKRKKV